MSNIEWKEGAICYANGEQWFSTCDLLFNHDDSEVGFNIDLIGCTDFQLNEPKQGDYLPKSELDTEQKYNDAVEVFGLFGFKPHVNHQGYNNMIQQWLGLEVWRGNIASTNATDGRKLTYSQLMAIGKLKRLMNEREVKQSGKSREPKLSKIKLKEPMRGYDFHLMKPKRLNKSKQAYEILKSLDYEYDLVKQCWYRKEWV